MNAIVLSFPSSHSALSFEERVDSLLATIAATGRRHAYAPASRALAALLCALGNDEDMRSIIEALPQDDDFTLESAMHACTHLGYKVHTLALHASDIDPRTLPGIFAKNDALYTLLELHDEGIYAYDATTHTYHTLPPEALNRGRLICPRIVTHQSRERERDAKKAASQGWLRSSLGHFQAHFTQLFAVSFVLGLISLSTPLLIMLTYDRVIGVHATNDLTYLAMGFALALTVEAILRFMRARHLAWLGTRIDTTSTRAIIERLLHLPANMIERASVASQIARIKGFEEIRDFFTGPLFLTLIELPLTLLMIAALAIIAGNIVFIPLNKLKERVTRLEIRSPISGVVKGITVQSPGTVVKPGQTLFEIVPTGDTLIADIRIAPKDIGNVYPGQPVRIKVSSYDFSRYGALDGTLDLISATTFSDDKGEKYFAGSVSLASSYIAAGGKRLELMPGMTVEADIVTGEKAVLGYLLKPVRVAMEGALTEK